MLALRTMMLALKGMLKNLEELVIRERIETL